MKRAINNCGHRVVSHDSLIWKYLDRFAHFSASVALSALPTPISLEGILLEYKYRLQKGAYSATSAKLTSADRPSINYANVNYDKGFRSV